MLHPDNLKCPSCGQRTTLSFLPIRAADITCATCHEARQFVCWWAPGAWFGSLLASRIALDSIASTLVPADLERRWPLEWAIAGIVYLLAMRVCLVLFADPRLARPITQREQRLSAALHIALLSSAGLTFVAYFIGMAGVSAAFPAATAFGVACVAATFLALASVLLRLRRSGRECDAA
jgi:hypothetical protein